MRIQKLKPNRKAQFRNVKKNNEIESITNEYDSKNQNYNEIQKKYYELMTEAGKIEKSLEYEQKSEKEKRSKLKTKKNQSVL